jgi:hypothetical protein
MARRSTKNRRAKLRGNPTIQFPLEIVRIEPYVVPISLTGDNIERVDTCVASDLFARPRRSARLCRPADGCVYRGRCGSRDLAREYVCRRKQRDAVVAFKIGGVDCQ